MIKESPKYVSSFFPNAGIPETGRKVEAEWKGEVTGENIEIFLNDFEQSGGGGYHEIREGKTAIMTELKEMTENNQVVIPVPDARKILGDKLFEMFKTYLRSR